MTAVSKQAKTNQKAYQLKWQRENKEKLAEYNKTWRAKNPDKVLANNRDKNLQANYGITLLEYEKMLADQNEVCLICKTNPDGKRLNVDHDHDTNAIRGLLCWSCNIGLGSFKDNIARLISAIEYLRNHEIKNS